MKKTETAFAWLVVVVALTILAIALGPSLYALYTHAPPPSIPLTLLGIGISALFLGGWLMPNERVGKVLRGASIIVAPYIPSFGRRANSGEVVTPPADLPKDG